MIFVTVGAERFPFDRLIEAADQAARLVPDEDMFLQIGHSGYVPHAGMWTRFLSFNEQLKHIEQARVIVSHAGVGSLLLCAQVGKIPVLVPRRKQFREHVDDHQVELAVRMAQLGCAVVVSNPETLSSVIREHQVQQINEAERRSMRPSLAEFLTVCLAGDGRAPLVATLEATKRLVHEDQA